jgi:hypothetical protein
LLTVILDDKRAKSSEPVMPTNENIVKDSNKGSQFKSFEDPTINTSNSKSVERGTAINLSNQKNFIASANSIIHGEKSNKQSSLQPNTILSTKKDDLVDTISEAAKKLINDPRSYYHNMKKDEKPLLNHNIDQEVAKDSRRPEDSAKLEHHFTFNKNQSPIEPYQKANYREKKHEEDSSPTRSKQVNPSPKVEREPIPSLKDIKLAKRKYPEPVQAKVPPMPVYKPLPCLECKNIKSI